MPVPVPVSYAPLYSNPGVFLFGSDLTSPTNNTTTNSLFFPFSMASFQPYANFTQSMHQATAQQQNPYQYRPFSTTRFPIASPLTVGSTPSPPLNFSSAISSQQFPSTDIKSSVGILVSLNSHQGVLAFSCKANDDSLSDETNYVSFEIKHFGDQAVVDLTQVLRIGFALKFQAVLPLVYEGNKSTNYVATFVAPASSEDLKSASLCNMTIATELQRLSQNLDTPVGGGDSLTMTVDAGRQQQQQLPYDVDRETKALQLLMDIFRQNASPQCPLHTIHCIVSNCRDETMYNYVGKSSLKRRQFIEQRCHLFYIGADDTVCLVPGALYVAVTTLIREMLKRGGAMLLQELFDSYLTWADVPLESRELVGDTKQQFLKFLDTFPFAFSVFPSRVFVSVRRRMPDFDYSSFLIDCFGDQEGSLLWNGNQQSMSASIGGGGSSAPPPLTPSTCHTPRFPVPSTPYSSTSNFSGSNEDNSTKFSFPSAVHHDKNSNFVNVWSNFEETLPPPPPPPPLPTGNVIMHNYYQSHASTANASTTNSSVGSSSLSLASFSSDPVPPTPPVSCQPIGLCQPLLTDCLGNHMLNFNVGSNNAPSMVQQQVSADSSFSATPGFWKSYDIGTEDLVKNLTRFSYCRSPSSSLYTNTSDATVHSKQQVSAQTADFACCCPRCGYEYTINQLNINEDVKQRSFNDFGCQTDDFPSLPPVSVVAADVDVNSDDVVNDATKKEAGAVGIDNKSILLQPEHSDNDSAAEFGGDSKDDDDDDDDDDDIANSVANFALDD